MWLALLEPLVQRQLVVHRHSNRTTFLVHLDQYEIVVVRTGVVRGLCGLHLRAAALAAAAFAAAALALASSARAPALAFENGRNNAKVAAASLIHELQR